MHKHMHMETVLPYHILYITLNPGSISKARITAYANSKWLLSYIYKYYVCHFSKDMIQESVQTQYLFGVFSVYL